MISGQEKKVNRYGQSCNIIMQAEDQDQKMVEEDFSDEEGFAKEEVDSLIVVKEKPASPVSPQPTTTRIKHREPRHKLTFLGSKPNSRQQLRRAIARKEDSSRHGQSVELPKKEGGSKTARPDYLKDCFCRIKRRSVGQNILIPSFSLNDSKNIKSYLIGAGISVLYELPKQLNTHGYLRRVSDETFIGNEMNKLLFQRIRESFIMPRKPIKPHQQDKAPTVLQFSAEHESANLEYAAIVGENEYEAYLKNDSNTHGHQVWFNFRAHNPSLESVKARIHICNIKRDLKLLSQGGTVFSKAVGVGKEDENWRPEGSGLQFKLNPNPKFGTSRVYRLSFDLTIAGGQQRQISLLPSYTYSQLLAEIEKWKESPFVRTELLTYSLLGLALPLITVSDHESSKNKNVILINCRVHPGQTNASFMCSGLMKALASNSKQSKQLLQKNIIKIVPMLNPDGVVFGNFRTNFLGSDLNRCFDSEDEIINPEVYALKQLGVRIKKEYGDRFTLFLDLHGHSSQKNIFAYGPDYETTESNFYQIRLLPKILGMRSKFFKYGGCRFRLEEFKRNTARGFFLNEININAYTIESSYSLFVEEGKKQLLTPQGWKQFGADLAEGLSLLGGLTRLSSIKSKTQMRKALSEADKEQVEVIQKFKKEFKKEKETKPTASIREGQRSVEGQDSDGENQNEDYTRAEQEEVTRRIVETTAPNLVLPRVLKPSIVYPTVTPKLFRIRDQIDNGALKLLYTRRGSSSKYGALRQGHLQALRDVDLTQAGTKALIL